MEVVLLGTGSAEGWPNPWCTCASCEWMRANGDIRGQTSALVDDWLLLDCGPEAPRAALRAGRSLATVRHLLFTHAHPDHTGAAALMWRGWTHPREPLDVAGPPAVIEECRRWVAPDAAVRWHPLAAGDRVTLGGYDVRALAAEHGDESVGPALLFDVTAPSGERLLWATDTKGMSEATLTAVSGREYDAALLEETNGDDLSAGTDHLDLRSWPLLVAELRRRGAVTARTHLLPIHLSHGNPPPPRLQVRMASWGARVPAEGEVIRVGRDDAATASAPRARRVLVLGGARSGKSSFAESMLAAGPAVTYVATALPRPDDIEWQARVEKHRQRRPVSWQTVETLDLESVVQGAAPGDDLLVECATLWLSALLEGLDADPRSVDDRVEALVRAVTRSEGRVVIVSNEVGDGVVPPTEAGRRFRDELGRLNARLAATCDEVWRVTAGIPVRLA